MGVDKAKMTRMFVVLLRGRKCRFRLHLRCSSLCTDPPLAGEVQKGKLNEKNSRTTINPEKKYKYPCTGLKNSYRGNFSEKKKFLRLENSPPR